MTAHGTIDSAVEAMRKGAFDYLTKPLEKDELLLVLRPRHGAQPLVRENRLLQEQLRDRFRLENIVGAHGSMQDVFRIVHKVAASTSTVLIYGESGTGKELIARALHHESDRRDRPFYAVNWPRCPRASWRPSCSATRRAPSPAPTAARSASSSRPPARRCSWTRSGDLKRDLQVKLLRALQEREILRVGGTERIKVDVRIVAATNQDLERDGARGPLPRGPLLPAERHPDRAAAAARAAHRHPAAGRALPRASTAPAGRRTRQRGGARRCSMAYDWPGNVRELESVIERALLLGEGDAIVPEDLPAAVRARRRDAARPLGPRDPRRAASTSRRSSGR